MQSTERDLLQAAKEAPDDDSPRLILADWLEENGQAERAEFVRLQLGLTPDSNGRWWELAARSALLERHAARWLGPFEDRISSWQFERGLLHVHISKRKIMRELTELGDEVPWSWVEGLHLDFRGDPSASSSAQVDALETVARLTHLTSLDLFGSRISSTGACRLAHMSELRGLTSLNLARNQIGRRGAAALAASPHLARLQYLVLNDNGISDGGVTLLAQSPHLRKLRSLELAVNDIGPAGAMALAHSPYLGSVHDLYLAKNSVGRTASAALRKRFGKSAVMLTARPAWVAIGGQSWVYG